MREYEDQAKELVEYTKQRQKEEEDAKINELRQQMFSRKPMFSKHVLQTRIIIDRLVRQRKYLEAEDMRRNLQPIEQAELEKFEEDLKAQVLKKEKAIRNLKRNEVNALQQRIKSGREELKSQRKLDFERLQRAHQNALAQLDQRSRLHHSKTKDWVGRQLLVISNSPAKTSVYVSDRQGYGFTPRNLMSPIEGAASGANSFLDTNGEEQSGKAEDELRIHHKDDMDMGIPAGDAAVQDLGGPSI
jgi:hypothetical protein